MEENFFILRIPPIPVLKEGAELWFLEVVNGNMVLCKDTVVSACVVSNIESNKHENSVVEYRIKNHADRLVRSYEIGIKYFLSKYDLSDVMKRLFMQMDPCEDMSVIYSML